MWRSVAKTKKNMLFPALSAYTCRAIQRGTSEIPWLSLQMLDGNFPKFGGSFWRFGVRIASLLHLACWLFRVKFVPTAIPALNFCAKIAPNLHHWCPDGETAFGLSKRYVRMTTWPSGPPERRHVQMGNLAYIRIIRGPHFGQASSRQPAVQIYIGKIVTAKKCTLKC